MLEATALRTNLHQSHIRRIVNKEGGRVNTTLQSRKVRPALGVQITLLQATHRNLALGRENTHRQLSTAHLQGKENRRHVVMDSCRTSNIQSQGRLAHTRTSRNHNHLATVQATRQLIKLDKVSRHAVHAIGTVRVCVNLTHRRFQGLREGHVVFLRVAIRHRVNLSLRLIHQSINLSLIGITQLSNLRTRLNQAAHNRVLLNNLSVILSVSSSRNRSNQSVQIRRATHTSQLAALLQLIGNRNRIRRATVAIQRKNRLINRLVRRLIEIGRTQALNHIRNSVL